METISEVLCIFVAGLLAVLGHRLVSKSAKWALEEFKSLSIPWLHISPLALSVITALPLTPLASISPESGLWFCGAVHYLGVPLILLGGPLAAFLRQAFSITSPSLDTWVLHALFIIQWIVWGQVAAVSIRWAKTGSPGADIAAEPLAGLRSSFFERLQAFKSRYSERQVGGILVLIMGLAFLLFVCLLVVSTLRQG